MDPRLLRCSVPRAGAAVPAAPGEAADPHSVPQRGWDSSSPSSPAPFPSPGPSWPPATGEHLENIWILLALVGRGIGLGKELFL